MNKISNIKFIFIALIAILIGSYFLFGGNSVVDEIKPRAVSTTEGIKIIAFGDSLTAGYGLPAGESYPTQLEAALKAKGFSVKVINSGVSGETTRGNLERASFIRKQNPDLVLLGIGGNDALRLLPVEETKKNILETIKILKSGEQPPVIVLLKMQAPINVGLGYKQSFDSLYKEISDEEKILLLPFITAEVFLNSSYKLPDGIHFNQAGYQKITELYLLEPVIEIIEKMTK